MADMKAQAPRVSSGLVLLKFLLIVHLSNILPVVKLKRESSVISSKVVCVCVSFFEPERVVPLVLIVRPGGQGSVTDRNACEHALLGGMHGGIAGA